MLPNWPLLAACIGMLTGCVNPVSPPDVTRQAGQAVGVEQAICFRTTGGQVNEIDNTPEMLTELQAVRQALFTDPEIQMALAKVRAAEADARQARLLPNPIVSLGVRYRFGPESPVISPSISEDLVSILEMPRQASAADHRLRGAAADALTAVLNTVSEVQEQYADVQAGEAQLTIMTQRQKVLNRLLEVTRARLKGGEGSRLDLTTVEAQDQSLQTDAAQLRIELHESRLHLAQLIGQPGGRTDWKVSRWTAPPRVGGEQKAWLTAAMCRRPEIQSACWELSALGDDVALSRFAPWEGATIGVDAERDGDWSVGPSASIPIPIFDMGQEKHAKAIAALIEGRHKLTQARRQVVEDVRKAYDTFAALRELLDRARTNLLPLQESRYRLTEAAYRAGESDLATLLLAEEDLQDTRGKLVELEQKSTVAFVRLQRAVGGPGIAADLIPTAGPTTAPGSH